MADQAVVLAPGLSGTLYVPSAPIGVVVLVDGSSGARERARHRIIAGHLQRRHLATLTMDTTSRPHTTTEMEDWAATHRLAGELLTALDWLRCDRRLEPLAMGVFGSGIGAAAAVVAVAERSSQITALVCRAGLLDLVLDAVARVRAATLLVVGALDEEALSINREAYSMLQGHKRLEVVARATHLFEEAGALDRVGAVAADWFELFLGRKPP